MLREEGVLIFLASVWLLLFCQSAERQAGVQFFTSIAVYLISGFTCRYAWRIDLSEYDSRTAVAAQAAVLALPALAVAGTVLRIASKVLFGVRPRSDPLPKNGPYILPCRTSHTRMFPKKHSFAYSYLQVAVPVGWKGSIGSLLAVDQASKVQGGDGRARWRHWLTVDGADYLYRGGEDLSLDEKLAEYLRSQSVNPASYDSAWLVTAPRFLGYAFNPVSFWYLYRAGVLRTIVLEVNNTFGERRLYLVDVQADPATAGKPFDDTTPKGTKHRAVWAKDFHVSPFNSREGTYSLAASPPAFSRGIGIDNVITLRDPDGQAKLVARLQTAAPPVDAAFTTSSQRAALLFAWGWVGLITFPRIVRQAASLFFRRGLQVWYRPEVLRGSLGRAADEREKAIAVWWRDYLAARAAAARVRVRYLSAAGARPREETLGADATAGAGEADEKGGAASGEPAGVFEVLTPAFYSEVVRAPTVAAYFAANDARPPERRTFHASGAAAALFSDAESTDGMDGSEGKNSNDGEDTTDGKDSSDGKDGSNSATRSASASAADGAGDSASAYIKRSKDRRVKAWWVVCLVRGEAGPEHELDAFVLRRTAEAPEPAREYRQAVFSLAGAERLRLGTPALFDAVWWLGYWVLIAGNAALWVRLLEIDSCSPHGRADWVYLAALASWQVDWWD